MRAIRYQLKIYTQNIQQATSICLHSMFVLLRLLLPRPASPYPTNILIIPPVHCVAQLCRIIFNTLCHVIHSYQYNTLTLHKCILNFHEDSSSLPTPRLLLFPVALFYPFPLTCRINVCNHEDAANNNRSISCSRVKHNGL